MMYAHNWEILGGDRIPRWPSEDDPRTIHVSVTSWVGLSVGAKHYSVRVEEEHNQWWSEDENTWTELSCDSGKRGYSFTGELMTKKDAEEFANHCIELIKRLNPNQSYDVFKNMQDN